MAENIVINNSPPQSNSGGSSSILGSLIRPIITLITVITIIALIFGLILLVENWEAVGVFFTTGFIGWLNPFDSPDGDTGPVDIVVEKGTNAGLGVLSFFPVIGPIFRGFLPRR